MEFATNQRVFVAGQTGSGKTFFCKYALKDVRRLIVFDAKGTLNDWNLSDNINDLEKLKDIKNSVRLRIRIPIGDLKEIAHVINGYLETIYRYGNVVVYFDEIFSIATAVNYPPYLIALYTRGRELGIGIWTVAQRPFNIPQFAFSEADWFVMFKLMMDKDKDRMSETMGKTVKKHELKSYEFFIYNTKWDKPELKKLKVA